MRIPLSWLRTFVDINFSVEELAQVLTLGGLEVEDIEAIVPAFEGVVVAKVIEHQPHPQADRLCIAKVFDGTQTLQVVCGAPNCRAGLKTALARVDARVLDDKGRLQPIKKGTLRGVESFGMLCSAEELGVGSSPEGILELSEDLAEGTPLADLFADTVLDIGLTPNLWHCASVFGVARELAALRQLPLRELAQPSLVESAESLQAAFQVTVADAAVCPRYSCRLLRGVKVGPSPFWMRRRLELCGVRSINNVVDVTNYVLMESGHPLHAFDLRAFTTPELVVRYAREGEPFRTLDGVDRVLSATFPVIADVERPLAIAGIMGGESSEIAPDTTDVLIESALFDPRLIRRASKRLGLATESSRRFEKGADPQAVPRALHRAAGLMGALAGGQLLSGFIDVAASDFPPRAVSVRLGRINDLLGTSLAVGEVEGIWNQLHFSSSYNGKYTFIVQVPTYRSDITLEVDLVEEVARVYGYDHLPRGRGAYTASTQPHAPSALLEREVRRRLVAEGLQELLTNDLISPSQAEMVPESVVPREALVRLLNPVSVDLSVMRTSLLPSHLQVVKHNVDHQQNDVAGFEVGWVYQRRGDRYVEGQVAALVLSGQRLPGHWGAKREEVDFFDLKGIVENFCAGMGIENLSFRSNALESFHPGRRASLCVGDSELGVLGEVHPALRRRLDLGARVFFAEISLAEVARRRRVERVMVPLPLFPASERDYTATFEEAVPVEEVLTVWREGAPPLLESVQLIDLYRGEALGAGWKNATFRFTYRDLEKTLSQEAVEAAHAKLLEKARQKWGSRLKDLQSGGH